MRVYSFGCTYQMLIFFLENKLILDSSWIIFFEGLIGKFWKGVICENFLSRLNWFKPQFLSFNWKKFGC